MSGQQAFFEALTGPAQACPPGLASWNGSDPASRFKVYRNGVAAKLIDALADTFPVTQELVGTEFFRAMALSFVREAPPRSRVLAVYGAAFPEFIESFPPAATVPYLADVARLELLRVRSYHAADAVALPAETIARALAQPDALPSRQVGFHPSVALLPSRYAVVSLWAAHQGAVEISRVDPYEPENALIVRPQLDVEIIRVGAAAAAFIGHLSQGSDLGTAAGLAVAAHPQLELADIFSLLIRTHAILAM